MGQEARPGLACIGSSTHDVLCEPELLARRRALLGKSPFQLLLGEEGCCPHWGVCWPPRPDLCSGLPFARAACCPGPGGVPGASVHALCVCCRGGVSVRTRVYVCALWVVRGAEAPAFLCRVRLGSE